MNVCYGRIRTACLIGAELLAPSTLDLLLTHTADGLLIDYAGRPHWSIVDLIGRSRQSPSREREREN